MDNKEHSPREICFLQYKYAAVENSFFACTKKAKPDFHSSINIPSSLHAQFKKKIKYLDKRLWIPVP